jgi:hypothetical protein
MLNRSLEWERRLKRYPFIRTLLAQLTFRKLSFVVIFLLIFYYITSWIHTETYTWQTTVMSNYVHTPERYECPLLASDPLGEPLLRSSSLQNDYTRTSAVPTGRLKIGILMLFSDGGGSGGWSGDVMQRVMENRVRYCRKHGYIPVVVTTDPDDEAPRAGRPPVIDPGRPVAWSKFLAIQRHLPEYDYLAYIDMDAIIMDFNTPLEAFIEVSGPCSDVILTEDWNGPNTGVYIVKNTPWSRWFVAHAWELGLPLVSKRSPGGTKHPFEYEQRVVHYLLESNIWKKRELSKYRRKDAHKLIRSHISVLPQCAFNSYSMHPLDSRGLPNDVSRYMESINGKSTDFLIHFAGKKGQIKTNLIEYYLTISERE